MEKQAASKRKGVWCYVPMCKNTGISTPNKVFITVPSDEKTFLKWMKAARRDMKESPLSLKTHAYCCEDHFDLENDVENYMRWKMQNVKIRLKKGVVPHIFECQGKCEEKERSSCTKLNQGAVIRKLLVNERDLEVPSSSTLQLETISNEESPIYQTSSICGGIEESLTVSHPNTLVDQSVGTSQPPAYYLSGKSDKYIQANIRPHFKSIKTQTKCCVKASTATSPFKRKLESVATSPLKISMQIHQSGNNNSSESSSSSPQRLPKQMNEYLPSTSESSSGELEIDPKLQKKSYMKVTDKHRIILYLERDPKYFLGLPKDMYFLINILSKKIPTKQENIMIVLKKIRLDDGFKSLAYDFGIHFSTASRIFDKTVPLMAKYLTDLLCVPDYEAIQRSLPLAFRARYGKVSCIIDCLEIEKPSNPVHQALTWSEYKKANTLKYLISCTPGGFITFVSKGYGGRTSDEMITENCGFLDTLLPNTMVMADRGFKRLESQLTSRNCTLVRPPSVAATQKMTKTQVRSTKRIASLRIHVERVIGRLRDFSILRAKSVVDHNLLHLVDNIIKISCSIVNLQSFIIQM